MYLFFVKYLKITIFILIIIFSHSFVEAANFNDDDRPKIGLVLSGGGALGFAHIGMLQVIDSLNIPIDYIAGTSMGGIAGGLYALGYTGDDIEQLVQNIDWIDIFTDMPERKMQSYFQKKDDGKYQFSFGFSKGNITVPSGLIHGQKISMLLSNLTNKYEQIENFNNLKIPFRCVAVDLYTGNEVILKNGSISKALRSTMSIPSAFNPVEWGDSLLIDGGLLNNLPVDVVKDMGADIVIAVNVSLSTKSITNLNSALKILERTIAIPASNRSNENIKDVDLYVEPELSDYLNTDFGNRKIIKIIEKGKIAANKAIPKLIQICDKNGFKLENISSSKIRTIRNIYIGGNKNLSTEYINKLLNINSNDYLNIDTLEARISSIKLSEDLYSIDYELSEINDNQVDILLNIQENTKPTIYRVSVRGNKSIPFSFIYRFLGVAPTDTLDIDLINKRIDELYGMGYFETISYEIEPVDDDSIHLIFIIKEATHSLLRLGFMYDETSKFIGTLNLVSTKVFVPGLRFESTLRFSGLFDLRAKLYYPFRLNDISVYPYIRTYNKSFLIDIYGSTGSKVARYNDRSASWGAGFGFLSSKNWATEIEYNSEYIDVNPNVALPDTIQFPSWKDELHKLQVSTTFDNRNDVIIPKKGTLLNITYEGSSELLNTDVLYNKYELNLEYYKTYRKRHTFRLFTQFGHSNDKLPIYKWFYYGGPNKLVGAEKNEFVHYRTSIFGIDYRFMITDKLYLKTIYNIAPNYGGDFYPIELKTIYGYGFGLKYVTYLGPLELIFSRGTEITSESKAEMKSVFYLRFGYYLN